MQPDDRRRADTLSWFKKAHKDLRCAQIDLAADPPAPEDASYHCQHSRRTAASGSASSTHRISKWHSRAANSGANGSRKNSRVLRKLWAQTLADVFASRCSTAIRNSAPYSGSASANSTKLSK